MLDQGCLLNCAVGASLAFELHPVSLMNLHVASEVNLRGQDLYADLASASLDILLRCDLVLQLLMGLQCARRFVGSTTFSNLADKITCFRFMAVNIFLIVIHF